MTACVSLRAGLLASLVLSSTLPQLMAHDASGEMADAAVHFLSALTVEQREKAVFEWGEPERFNWHYVPRDRRGLCLKEMSTAQRQLAMAFLASGLSSRGMVKVATIMSLEEILRDIEEGRGPVRDAELYYFTFFGTPSTGTTWGWRVEGHHLSVNFTVVKGEVVSGTPSFLGSNPAEVRTGPRRGLRVLSQEEDLARSLVNSLSAAQRPVAVLEGGVPSDILSRNMRTAVPLEPAGLLAGDMTESQRERLMSLIHEYVERYRAEFTETIWKGLVESGVERIGFVWVGSMERGKPHYYRVQGPTFLLEYDNTQNGANHAHSVWRDFKGDFGEDLLRRHYEESPHHLNRRPESVGGGNDQSP